MGNIVYVVLYLTSAFYVDGLVNSFVDPIVLVLVHVHVQDYKNKYDQNTTCFLFF